MSVMQQVRQVILRILAVFVATGLSVIGAGSIAGIEIYQAVAIAGISGVAVVVEGLARAFIADGNLSADEINAVFSEAESASKKK
jgi:hypothetical protein